MENLGWGLQMTILGMGLVFALLALLWGLLTAVLRLDAAPADREPDAPTAVAVADGAEVATSAGGAAAAIVNGMEADLVAAMMVAVLTHRAVRRRAAAPVMRSYWPGSLLYASRWVGTGRARQNHCWQRRGK
jgi:Na+-transporting methylmalonyl-CoA/oxaloacetate decarboxylase gamma subunit